MLRVLVIAGAVFAAASVASAQTFRDRLAIGAEKAREGAGRIVDNVERSIDGSIDLLTDEATPEETRAELDQMAFATLERLFAERPEAVPLFEESAGYAVFDTRRVTFGVTAGAGRGVAVNKITGERVYMNMGMGGVGVSFGLGGFETQVVILFQSPAVLEEFVTRGLDASAEAGSMFGDDKQRATVKFADGRSIFYLTRKGWKVSAAAAGTRYWVDVDLN